jgi:hypothetical protein
MIEKTPSQGKETTLALSRDNLAKYLGRTRRGVGKRSKKNG